MDEMRTRGPRTGLPAIVQLLAVAVLLIACVPDPTNRPSSSDGAAAATPTPIPTLAGPTPSPSFVRPTPTPQPTFMTYTVVTGDSLDKIAKRFGTTGRSIAYWNRATYPSLDPESSAYRPNYLRLGWILVLIPHMVVDPENLPSLPPAARPSGG
jgi:hypothetical protein